MEIEEENVKFVGAGEVWKSGGDACVAQMEGVKYEVVKFLPFHSWGYRIGERYETLKGKAS